MGIFSTKVEPKKLIDQVDVEALKPDPAAITVLKKKITHARTVATAEYLVRKEALIEEKRVISENSDPAANGVKFNGGFSSFISSVSEFLQKKYHTRSIIEVEEEEELLERWAKEYFHAFMDDIEEHLKPVRATQQEKLNYIQDNLETASNADEVDALYTVIVGEYHDLLNSLRWYAQYKKNGTFEVSAYQLKRQSFADKQMAAKKQGASDHEYARRLANFHTGGAFE